MTSLEYDLSRDVWCMFGLPFDRVTMQQTIESLKRFITLGQQGVLTTSNVNFVVAANKHPEFRESILDSEINVIDGMPLLWIARLLGFPFSERVAGSTLMDDLMNSATRDRITVFFFGGPKGVAAQAHERLSGGRGEVYSVGHYYPGFGSVEDMSQSAVLDQVNNADPDVLILALGAAKGQEWIMKNRQRLDARVISHLGATVNFAAGTLQRAPGWVQRAGLEWVWRIIHEPRLWWRYAKDGIGLLYLFMFRVLPYWVMMKFTRRAYGSDTEFKVTKQIRPGQVQLQFHGTAVAAARPIALPYLEWLVNNGENVTIDFSDLRYIDSSFIATLLLVRKNVLRIGASFRVVGCSKRIRRIMKLTCSDYILQ